MYNRHSRPNPPEDQFSYAAAEYDPAPVSSRGGYYTGPPPEPEPVSSPTGYYMGPPPLAITAGPQSEVVRPEPIPVVMRQQTVDSGFAGSLRRGGGHVWQHYEPRPDRLPSSYQYQPTTYRKARDWQSQWLSRVREWRPSQRAVRAAIGGIALGLAGIIVPSTLQSPAGYAASGTEPVVRTPVFAVWPTRQIDGKLQWPFLIGETGYQTDEERAEAEASATRDGVHECKNGTLVNYITVGPMTASQMEDTYCGVSNNPDDKKSKEIEEKVVPRSRADIGDGFSVSPICAPYENGERLVCEARFFTGIYYKWAGGHWPVPGQKTYADFVAQCPDPTNPPNNKPDGAKSNVFHHQNPSPCGVDCSGLVAVAVNRAFGQNVTWNVAGIKSNKKYWKKVGTPKLGDVATRGANTHVEFVLSYNSGNGIVKTFGSHTGGKRIGESSGKYDSYYRYVGPGAT